MSVVPERWRSALIVRSCRRQFNCASNLLKGDGDTAAAWGEGGGVTCFLFCLFFLSFILFWRLCASCTDGYVPVSWKQSVRVWLPPSPILPPPPPPIEQMDSVLFVCVFACFFFYRGWGRRWNWDEMITMIRWCVFSCLHALWQPSTGRIKFNVNSIRTLICI